MRVSTKEKEQLYSYETQSAYYEKLLGNDPEIDYVGLYADKAKSGSSMKARKEFMRMIGDCYDGKIDRIRTKSVSRFARNTSECLEMVKKLRQKNVFVHFETYNIDTKDEAAMLILTIAAAIAEEELRNISQNITWAVKNKYEQGKAWMPGRIYGYKVDNRKELEQTEFEIIPAEAIIVQRIYRDYLAGSTISAIANDLTAKRVPTPRSKEKWGETTVKTILENEKYCGDLLLQKTYKPDVLSKRRKNDRKRDMKLVENNHLPIIDKATWNQVQIEMAARERTNDIEKGTGKYSSKYVFSTKIECGECGTKYRRHAQWAKDEKRPIWVCIKHQKRADECGQTPLKETSIEQAFVSVLEKAQANKTEYIGQIRTDIENAIKGTSHLNVDGLQAELERKQTALLDMHKKQRGKVSQADVDAATALMDDINELNAQIKLCKDAEDEKNLLDYRMRMIDTALNMTFTKFNDDLFKALIEKIVVLDKTHLRFIFKSGIEIEQEIAA